MSHVATITTNSLLADPLNENWYRLLGTVLEIGSKQCI